MNVQLKIIAAVLMILTAACNENSNPDKTAGSGVLKTQTEALEKAKQVDQLLQQGAQQQSEKIDAQTQ